MAEVASLPNLKVPDTDIEVKPDGYPSLLDGKTKKNWAKGTHGHWSCWFCNAYSKQLGERKYLDGKKRKILNPKFKVKDKKLFRMGFGQCHWRNRSFDGLVKYALHKDFKMVECRYLSYISPQ